MGSGYSITIQVVPSYWSPDAALPSPGHVAIVVNTPTEQTYVGFGPLDHSWSSWGGTWGPGKFDVQTVPVGTIPTTAHDDFSNVYGLAGASYFRLQGTES